MQKAFKHQACLNVFDGIWKNQLTLPGWLRGALCRESLQQRPWSLVPVLRAACAWGRRRQAAPNLVLVELSSPWSKKNRVESPSQRFHPALSGESANTRPPSQDLSVTSRFIPKSSRSLRPLCLSANTSSTGVVPRLVFTITPFCFQWRITLSRAFPRCMETQHLACVWPHFPLPGEKVMFQMILF